MLLKVLPFILIAATPAMVIGQVLGSQPEAGISVGLDQSALRKPVDNELPIQALTLADLEGLSFQNNPTLKVAAAQINVARGRQLQARLYPNPVAGYHATEIGNLGTAGQQGGFISQQFITAGKRKLDQAIAGQEIAEASFQLQAQQQRVLSDVRIRFYEALVAQQRVALTTDLARIGDELVKATETLIKGRQGTENDLLQAEIRADESRILLNNAENEHVEAWRRLSAVVGTPALPVAPLDGELDKDIPRLDWETCYAQFLSSNPLLNAARKRIDRAKLSIQRAKREPIPNVDVLVSVRHNNITGSDNANVIVGLPIPIFNKNQGNIRAAEADWIAACNELKRVELKLQDQLAVAYRRYLNALQQTERFRERMVPRARRSLDLVLDGYQKGQVQYLTLLTAQQTYVQVNLSYLDSVRELRRASSLIESQLLTDSFAGRN